MEPRRRTTENVLSVRVGDLYRRGRPCADAPLVCRGRDGQNLVTISLRPQLEQVVCVCERRRGSDEVERCAYELPVSWRAANLGGRRASLHCARPWCRARVGRVFLNGPYLVCRSCAGVRYPEPEPEHVRALAQIHAIRHRLGGREAFGAPVPERPKGMHDSTYKPLCAQLGRLEKDEYERRNRAIVRGDLSLRSELAREFATRIASRRGR